MRLRSVSLDQFRKFGQPMRIDGLADGINVLCAPNEFGKSTLLAAIRAVLFERHTSKTESIKSYQPRLGSAAPTVALEFEQSNILHRIEKRFILRPQAILSSNGIVFEADAAEERLAALLGVSATTRGARDAARQTASIWGALLVDQGESFSQASLGDGARATLSDCLQAELGTVSGGVAIARLLKPVQAQLAERLDGHGRPRDRYKAALADGDAATAELTALSDKRHALDDDLSALHAARRTLAQSSDPQQDEAARNALSEARQHRDALLGQRDRIGQATAAVELTRSQTASIQGERTRRAALVAQIDTNTRVLHRLHAAETEARQRLADADTALETGRAAQQTAQHAADQADRALRAARARQDEADRRARHSALRDRLRTADAHATRIAAMAARLDTLKPDDKTILALRQAAQDDRADRADRAALQAQATVVSIALTVPALLEQPGAAAITLPPGSQRLELNGPAVLHIENAGTIEIVPASGDRDRTLLAVQTSARRLRRLLDESACADLDEAERRVAERTHLGAALDEARRTLAAIAGPDGLAKLRDQEAATRPPEPEPAPAPHQPGTAEPDSAEPAPPGPIRDAGARPQGHDAAPHDAAPDHAATDIAAAPHAADQTQAKERDTREALPSPHATRDAAPHDAPTDADIATTLAAAQHAADQTQARERDAREALHGPHAARDAARTALAEAESGARTADTERTRLHAALDQALTAEPDAALDTRLATAERALSDANTALAALIAAAPEGTVPLADARIVRLEQAASNRADAQARERERIARLEARIAAEQGAGLDEQIELAARRQDEAARTVADNQREIAVLSLLRDTLLAADRTARERFLAPLVGRISPYLHALFPGASVALDERFLIAGLHRRDAGPMPEPEAFDTLSHGTREQVAILARLAFADMLAAGNHPSFLVLDDALAFADTDRMDRMFDILHEAGQRLQILVLTCREDVAARLGGHAVRLEPAGQG